MKTRDLLTISLTLWVVASVIHQYECKHSLAHLGAMKHIYKLTKRFGPHLGPILGAAAATGMGVVGVGIVRSPLSPFPVPSLPLPPVGAHPIKQVLHYPGHVDRVPKGYHYLPPIQHPSYNNLEYGYYGNMGYFGKMNKLKMTNGGNDYTSVSLNDIGHDWW